MAIDPKSIVWDEPAKSAIDPAGITWDEPAAPAAQDVPDAGRDIGIPDALKMAYRTMMGSLVEPAANVQAGVVRGAGSIGSTLLAPYDMAKDAMAGKGLSLKSNRERRAGIDAGLADLGADTDSISYKGGKLMGEIGGTAGVGPLLGVGAKAAGASPSVVSALQTGGLNVGGMTGIPAWMLRAGAGAVTGGASAGMVNPEDAKLGAAIGGAFPVSAKLIGSGLRGIGQSLRGQVAPEVAALAERAKQLDINIPADRITNSKPLNALAASLEYVPLSGRAATQEKMTSQLNRALSRTFGQDSDNVTMALRRAADDLGGKFDDVLKNNRVRVDQPFLDDLAEQASRATRELGSDGQRIIQNQIDDIMAKASPQATRPQPVDLKRVGFSNKTDIQATIDSLPPKQEGYIRLYRAESPTVKFDDIFDRSKLQDFSSKIPGKRYTPDFNYADYYRDAYGKDAVISYVDVPESLAAKVQVDQSEYKLSDDILNGVARAAPDAIDSQAAYNIKRTLDRIGKRNSPEAFYALDLKRSLMDALDRSLGPEASAAFAKTREQYGNMLRLEKIAKNGAEGDISIARLANMKNVNSPQLQELADIAAQFMTTRESPHGALQRLVIGGTGVTAGAGAGALPLALGVMAGGRVANTALNSGLLRSMVTRSSPLLPNNAVNAGLLGASKAAPVIISQ